jgi:SAM-dependent methyltransferase
MNLKSYFYNLVTAAEKMYQRQVQSLLIAEKDQVIALDCGCSNGEKSSEILGNLGARLVLGVDIEHHRLIEARKRGIGAVQVDLSGGLCFANESVDIIYSNQVIEHLCNTDRFISEIYRVLKRGAYAIICTENLASWHNIFSLLFGFQPFSLTIISSIVCGVGNPFALHRNQSPPDDTPWQHVRVFSYQGLKEIFEVHGFKVKTILGSGYYPLPAFLGNVDKRHAAFLLLKAYKE